MAGNDGSGDEAVRPPGSEYRDDDREIFISDEAVRELVAGFERVLDRVLTWTVEAPFQFTALLVFLLLVVLGVRKIGLETGRAKAQYEERRQATRDRVEPFLPFRDDDEPHEG